MLDAVDEEVHSRAQRLLEKQGSKVAGALARQLPSAPLARRRAIVSILARNRSLEALAALLATLRDPDVAEHTVSSIRAEMDRASERERKVVSRKIVTAIKGKGIRADAFALANALRLLGYVGDAATIPLIMGFLRGKQAVAVRVAAIAALRRPLATLKRADAVIAQLLELSASPDMHVTRAAIDTLRGVELPDRMAAPLIKLCDSQNGEARAFAAERLGTLDSELAARRLVEVMLHGEPMARDAASRSLAKLRSAARPLLNEIMKSSEAPAIRALATALAAHGSRIGPAQRRKIADRALRFLDRDPSDARGLALTDLVGTLDPKLRSTVLIDRAQRLKRASRLAEAATLLRLVARSGGVDDEGRYLIGAVGLAQGAKELARAARSTDPSLSQFTALLDRDFPLMTRLKKDPSLTTEHLYYLGFNFVESDQDDQRDFGAGLLRWVATKSPTSKIGRIAKNKLRLAGLAT